MVDAAAAVAHALHQVTLLKSSHQATAQPRQHTLGGHSGGGPHIALRRWLGLAYIAVPNTWPRAHIAAGRAPPSANLAREELKKPSGVDGFLNAVQPIGNKGTHAA